MFCTYCGEAFSSAEELQQHVTTRIFTLATLTRAKLILPRSASTTAQMPNLSYFLYEAVSAYYAFSSILRTI